MSFRSLAHTNWSDDISAPTAAERVLAAELQARGNESDALSMMVASMARMVQSGKASDSRWKSS
ncbi:hypothetical protein [Synechococcus sp. CCY 0621]|uniref:hypothetical protein n=1 Tax=Synechococcus sp. CCY 0621 TaxID=2815603 RepID=UPI001C219526|nr:hypothetical protein [Synechococcus sp. CCY 0621]